MKKAVLLLISIALAAMLVSCAANEDSKKQNAIESDTVATGELTREITVSYYDTMLYSRFLTDDRFR